VLRAARIQIEGGPIDSDSKKMLQMSMRFSYIGIFFGIAIALGWFGGSWLDRRWHTSPYLAMIGLCFGVAASFRELYRVSKKYMRESP
jgi:hypothetical protein